MKRFVYIGALLSAALANACGDRAEAWDKELDLQQDASRVVGLSGSVAVMDPALDRVLMLTAPNELSLETRAFSVGKEVAVVKASQDQNTLFVLSRGERVRRKADDERPSLTVLSGGVAPALVASVALSDPCNQLALDENNQFAVAYDCGRVVINPNELIVLDLRADALASGAAPISITLPAYGGRPQRLTFTNELSVPGAPARRFLIVQRETDVALVDLSALSSASVLTVPLPQTAGGDSATATNVVYHDRLTSDDEHGGRIAVQMGNDSSVLMLELARDTDGKHGYDLRTNLVDVGGIPAAIDFVKVGSTTSQLRLAALVGSKAVLVEPDTTTTTDIALPEAFRGITRITRFLSAPPQDGDVALLWGSSGQKIAFWALGSVEGTPYRSIDTYNISIDVQRVLDVPGESNARRKVLESQGQDFYVLDLQTRQSAPMKATAGLGLHVAPDGGRLWAYSQGNEFARLTFEDLHPISFSAERTIHSVFDIAAANGARTAVVLHTGASSGLGATVLDANNPDTATARFYSGLAFGGIR